MKNGWAFKVNYMYGRPITTPRQVHHCTCMYRYNNLFHILHVNTHCCQSPEMFSLMSDCSRKQL